MNYDQPITPSRHHWFWVHLSLCLMLLGSLVYNTNGLPMANHRLTVWLIIIYHSIFFSPPIPTNYTTTCTQLYLCQHTYPSHDTRKVNHKVLPLPEFSNSSPFPTHHLIPATTCLICYFTHTSCCCVFLKTLRSFYFHHNGQQCYCGTHTEFSTQPLCTTDKLTFTFPDHLNTVYRLNGHTLNMPAPVSPYCTTSLMHDLFQLMPLSTSITHQASFVINSLPCADCCVSCHPFLA